MTKNHITFCILLIFLVTGSGFAESPDENHINISHKPIISNVPIDIQFFYDTSSTISDSTIIPIEGLSQSVENSIQKVKDIGPFENRQFTLYNAVFKNPGKHSIILEKGQNHAEHSVWVIPHWFSILPPVLAILLALIFRQVLVALFVGIWLGVFFLEGYRPFAGLIHVIDTYIIHSLNDSSHLQIILFSMTLGGMVGILTRSGATASLMKKLSGWAHHPARGQIATWAMGLLIFFDDYANTLIVGNTMRPVTDRLKISREKLAYIVDSTAAPVVSVAMFSTWIGFELGLIQDGFNHLNIEGNAYLLYLQTIPYRFYCLLTLFFVFMIGFMQRDFGPMLKAEERARKTGKLIADNSSPLADITLDTNSDQDTKDSPWWHPFLTIFTVICMTLLSLYWTGRNALVEQGVSQFSLQEIIGQADPFLSLLYASAAGSFMAALLARLWGSLKLRTVIDSWINGTKSMVYAMIVLTLAWTISNICAELHTADYVINVTEGFLSARILPAITFLVAALISFATGTSWGTMSILIPIVMPLSYQFSLESSLSLTTATLAAVLSGAVFGDHCSPISDTTIMSSMASGSDHIDHVKTQMPYAMTVAGVALFLGYLPGGLGLSPWIANGIGLIVLFGIIRFFGKRISHP